MQKDAEPRLRKVAEGERGRRKQPIMLNSPITRGKLIFQLIIDGKRRRIEELKEYETFKERKDAKCPKS